MNKDNLVNVIEKDLGISFMKYVLNVKANGDIEKLRIDDKKLTASQKNILISKYPEIFGTNGEKFKDG